MLVNCSPSTSVAAKHKISRKKNYVGQSSTDVHTTTTNNLGLRSQKVFLACTLPPALRIHNAAASLNSE